MGLVEYNTDNRRNFMDENDIEDFTSVYLY